MTGAELTHLVTLLGKMLIITQPLSTLLTCSIKMLTDGVTIELYGDSIRHVAPSVMTHDMTNMLDSLHT